MPLNFKIDHDNLQIGLWEIAEKNEFFHTSLGFCTTKKSLLKDAQSLAGKLILTELDSDFKINNCDNRTSAKPVYLNNQFYFNISHSGKNAVAILSKDKEVGIDLEFCSEKIIKIQSRFLNREELQLLNQYSVKNQIAIVTLFWTVKEAVLKWIGDNSFDYLNDIIIEKFDPNGEKKVTVKLKKNKNKFVDVHYFKFNNYYVSYCF